MLLLKLGVALVWEEHYTDVSETPAELLVVWLTGVS